MRTCLLNATIRRIVLTEAGERYLQRCKQILKFVEEAEASDAYVRPQGKLRVQAMTRIGMHYVVPAIRQYQQRYPDVSIDLTLAPRIPDLLDEGYDVSVVLGNRLPDSQFVSTAWRCIQHRLRVAGLPREARRSQDAIRSNGSRLSTYGDVDIIRGSMEL